MPAQPPPQRPGTVLTRDRPERFADDVERARSGMPRAGSGRDGRGAHRTPAGRWRTFARRYGWRAYALPVLVVITIVALMSTNGASRVTDPTPAAAGRAGGGTGTGTGTGTGSDTAPPVAPGNITLKQDAGNGRVNGTALKAAALPPGAPYTAKGTGTFRVLKGTTPAVGTGKHYRYSIDVENGMSGVDLQKFQSLVVRTLADKRSWSGHGVSVQRVDSGRIDFHISLTSSMTVRKLCGYTIHVETSCYVRAGGVKGLHVNRVVFDDSRWVRGSAAYVGDLGAYQQYMINHEDGHAMGHEHAHQCLPGGLAPVMMQQTFGLRSASTGKLCEANPWPYPPGAAGAPGAEQPDTPANDEYGLSNE